VALPALLTAAHCTPVCCAAIDRYLLLVCPNHIPQQQTLLLLAWPQQQTLLLWNMLRQTDGQTPYHFIDPAPHTKQAVPKSSYSSRLYTQCTQRGCSRRLCRRPRRRVVYSKVLCIALQFLQRSFLLVNRFHVVADCSVNDVGGRSLQKSVPEHVLSTMNHLTYTEVTFHYY